MQFLRKLFNATLNNAIFAIALMVLIALYIAIGSVMPSLRQYFEMNQHQFLDAWAFKGLMLLLCLTLATFTWNHIPLTPPRYGAWSINAGIIVLAMGFSIYNHFKIQGSTLIPLGRTAVYFYDDNQRALYVRVPGASIVGTHPLPSLPRFKSYGPELKNSDQLHGKDMSHIDSVIRVDVQAQNSIELSRLVGVNDPVQLNVIGFYPDANIHEDVVEDPASEKIGVEIKIDNSHGRSGILTSSDPDTSRRQFDSTEVEHRNVSPSELGDILEAVQHMFHLTVALPGKQPRELDVELGKTYGPFDGYQISVDSFFPRFRMSTNEVVPALTLHVVSKSPAPMHEFWRMVLQGKELQTDFTKDPATTPEMPQKQAIDPALVLSFHFMDPAALLPMQAMHKHTLLTSGDHDLTDISATAEGTLEIRPINGSGTIKLYRQDQAFPAQVRRVDHVRVSTRLTEMPKAMREKETADSGVKQVVLVRVTCGQWSQDVLVPFNQYAIPDPDTEKPYGQDWEMGMVHIPGAISPLQIQLGNACMPLRARLTLEKFDLTPISSTLELADPVTNELSQAICTLNEPVHYDKGHWLFSQANYDPKGTWSVIRVTNQPGMMVMVAGCVLVVLGLLYAFIVQPIIRRL